MYSFIEKYRKFQLFLYVDPPLCCALVCVFNYVILADVQLSVL